MKKHIKTYDIFDVVVVPFPFIDSNSVKRRPALVISSAKYFNSHIEASVLVMITTATHSPWPLDVRIEDLKSAGLSSQSIVRMKLFTLDHRLISNQIGSLSKVDRKNISNALQHLFSI